MDLTWLQSLTPQQATLLSTAVGIPLGFVSLAVGALINATMNRRRDDKLRRQEALGVATALRVEAVLQRDALERNRLSLSDPTDAGDASHAYIPEPVTTVWDSLSSKLVLLDAEAIEKTLYAYGTLPTYLDGLALQLGEVKSITNKRLHIAVPITNAKYAADLTQPVISLFDQAIAALDRTIARLNV